MITATDIQAAPSTRKMGMRLIPAALVTALVLGGCVTYKTRSDGIARARINEAVVVDGPRLTPLKVVEDSRCPQGVQCIQAGRVVLTVRVELGSRSELIDLTMGQPQQVADGSLTLVEAWPDRKQGEVIYPEQYRFGFTFAGGL